MTKPFPDDPFLTGAMAPLGMEMDAPDLIVEGEIPADLDGTYFRNGPDPLHPPRAGDVYHWFDGDGMIWKFDIHNGRVSAKNRWVRTEKFNRELEAGESLFGVFNNPMTGDPSVSGVEYNTANTNIISHGGKLLALMEGAVTVEMDPDTLATKGSFNYGKIDGPITAHPKFDYKTGEIIFFGYQALGPGSKTLRYNVADKDGNLKKDVFFDAPFAAMVHDFFVTDTHAIFPIFPLTTDIERAMNGGPMMAWEPEKGAHFGIIPRDGEASDVVWHEMDARFMFHMMNAWTDGDKIHADVTGSNATQFAPKLDGTMATPEEGVAPSLRRWTFDLSGNTGDVKETLMDDMASEFPRTDDEFGTYKYRHGFAIGSSSQEMGGGFGELIHWDVDSGARQVHKLPDGYSAGEPVFARRKGSKDEGDGYVIMLGYDGNEHKSDLFVFDAMSIDKGPLATVKIPFRVPAGFHGNFVPA
jgi:carotenoid cleavage dioxygenase